MRQKKLTSAEIRQTFLDFFAARGHTIVPSAPLVPKDDPTLLFTNAGMNQFKDIFLGLGERSYTRAADNQKCMRVSGKHNDLQEVGPSPYHHTFFEMLGNWSFGDYYKKEAIRWAWELLTEVWHLPKERLWATVFSDDQGDLGDDHEAIQCWLEETYINPDHILKFGRKDNFWEMGDTGPCGPCSEIHLDRGEEYCNLRDDPHHRCQVNGDCHRFIELWNLVFIQYNRHPNGSLEELPNRHVDTGMGFERMASVLQGTRSNYGTDLFQPIMDRLQELLGHSDAQREANTVPYRVIADHGRAVTFLIGDGVLPGNEGRNYVLRMILRRAARYGKLIGFQGPFLSEIAKVVIDLMGEHYTELSSRRDFILNTITQEEERFQRTLDVGLELLDELMMDLSAEGKMVIPGVEAFRLYDTYGFPLDLTRDIAQERGFGVDESGFQAALQEQRERSRAAQQFVRLEEEELEIYNQLSEELKQEGQLPEEGVEHIYDEATEVETQVVAILRGGRKVRAAGEGDQVELLLPATPFYVGGGGQVSDTGFIAEDRWKVKVQDMREPLPGLVVHLGKVVAGAPQVGDEVRAMVDRDRRIDIMRNHTATHLLHAQLRHILGEHARQSGSLVAPDRLRFDFTHPEPLSREEIKEVERVVNEAILADYPVQVEHKGYKEAIAEGAIALFGEKYPERVSVLNIGPLSRPVSKELCGGTHVSHTSQIGLFLIISEESVGTGLRRIEAVTGRAAQRLMQDRLRKLKSAARLLSCPPEGVAYRVSALLEEIQDQKGEIARLNRKIARRDFEELLRGVQEVEGIKVLAAQVGATVPEMELLREMSDWFRNGVDSGVVILGTVMDSQPRFVAAITPDLVGRGLHAGRLAEEVAKMVGGGGGGSPTLGQAGGQDASKIEEALQMVPDLVAESIEH